MSNPLERTSVPEVYMYIIESSTLTTFISSHFPTSPSNQLLIPSLLTVASTCASPGFSPSFSASLPTRPQLVSATTQRLGLGDRSEPPLIRIHTQATAWTGRTTHKRLLVTLFLDHPLTPSSSASDHPLPFSPSPTIQTKRHPSPRLGQGVKGDREPFSVIEH